MEFNLDFNAPMFVDFKNEDLDANPESYFGKSFQSVIKILVGVLKTTIASCLLEIDHEAETPLGVPQSLIADEVEERDESVDLEAKNGNDNEYVDLQFYKLSFSGLFRSCKCFH
jgi:hypothetical protein